MDIVTHVLLPPITLPFRLFLGKRCFGQEHKAPDLDNDEVYSEYQWEEGAESPTDNNKDLLDKRHFMNPEFGTSFRSTAGEGSDLGVSRHRSMGLKRLESCLKQQQHTGGHGVSNSPSELDVDLHLQPSAFAFQTIPMDEARRNFCCHDDSEILTKSVILDYEEEEEMFPDCDGKEPYINNMYLYPNKSADDMEIGLFTQGKIPLRAMGAAMVYRTQLSGKSSQTLSDQRSQLSPSPMLNKELGSSMKLDSFRERNRMVRLESIIGRAHTPTNSIIEFGIMDTRRGELLERRLNQQSSFRYGSKSPQPPEFRNAKSNRFLSSHPISFLAKLDEECLTDDEDYSVNASTPNPTEKPEAERTMKDELRLSDRSNRCRSVSRASSSRRFRFTIDVDSIGLTNPFYEAMEPLHTEETEDDIILELATHHRSASSVSNDWRWRKAPSFTGLPPGAQPKCSRNEKTANLLLEQYLVGSVATSFGEMIITSP